MATISMFVCRSALVIVAASAFLACSSGVDPYVGVATLEPLVEPQVLSTPEPVDLRTVQAQDLLRIRDEHSALIALIPTLTPLPTRAPVNVAGAYLLDGEPLPGESLATDPRLGVWWYRHSGGDWTTSRFKNLNPYYPLFFDGRIDSRYGTFQNGGLQNEISLLLADEIVQILPVIGDRAPQLVAPLSDRLGWEFVDPDIPVVRLWTRFTFDGPDDLGPIEYRVGGVLAFTVAEHRDVQTGDALYQYPQVSNWIGQVLLEESPAQ